MSPRLPRGLGEQIATLANDPFLGRYGGRITPDDATLAARGGARGLAIYDALRRDGEVSSGLQKRMAALTARRWEVRPGANTASGREAAVFAKDVLHRLGIEPLAQFLLDAILMGLSIVELIWAETPIGIVPVAAKHRDPRRFTFRDASPEPKLRLLTRAEPVDGIALPERKFIIHRCRHPSRNPWGRGLGPVLFWPVFFKQRGVAFWLGGLERHGQPTAIGTYPAGTPEEEQEKLLAALQQIGSDAGVVIPEGMTIRFLDARRDGDFAAHERMARYMDAQITLAICGATLESRMHLRSVHEFAMADAAHLATTLHRTLLRWIVELNMPGALVPSIRWDFTDARASAKRAEVDAALFRMGYRLPEDRLIERYGTGYHLRQAGRPS